MYPPSNKISVQAMSLRRVNKPTDFNRCLMFSTCLLIALWKTAARSSLLPCFLLHLLHSCIPVYSGERLRTEWPSANITYISLIVCNAIWNICCPMVISLSVLWFLHSSSQTQCFQFIVLSPKTLSNHKVCKN